MRLSLIKKFERAFFVFFIIGLVFLGFVAGSLSAYFKTGPYSLVKDAMVGRQALLEKEKGIKNAQKNEQKREQKTARRERSKHESTAIVKEGAYTGYTLYTSPAGSRAVLVDMNGKPVHSWDGKFSNMWPDPPPQVDHPVPDGRVYWRDAYLYPNGDLLAVHEAKGDTPYGYGLVKIDKDSKLIWRYSSNTHHKLDIGSDGKVYVLSHKITREAFPGFKEGSGPVLEDFVAVLTPDGKEIDKTSLLDALVRSPYHEVFQTRTKGDVLHTNNVDVLEPDMAGAFPLFKAGQVLFSFRNISTIGVLDLKTREIVWTAKGPWKKQHNAKFRSDGTIMMFDNKGKGRKNARILQYDPNTKKTNVLYEGDEHNHFSSRIRGMEQALPNGNMLITEAEKGRIFEVNAKKRVVWEFKNPYQKKNKPVIITTGWRFGENDLPFIDKNAHPAMSGPFSKSTDQDNRATQENAVTVAEVQPADSSQKQHHKSKAAKKKKKQKKRARRQQKWNPDPRL